MVNSHFAHRSHIASHKTFRMLLKMQSCATDPRVTSPLLGTGLNWPDEMESDPTESDEDGPEDDDDWELYDEDEL